MNTSKYSMRKRLVALVSGVIFAAATGIALQAQGLPSNYVRKTVHTSTDTSAFKRVETAWLDGLGRPTRTVRTGASPAGGDLAEWMEYDSLGRESREWLPVPAGSGGNPLPDTTLASSARSFYTDVRPFRETLYDGSPLSRIRKVIGPGSDWFAADKAVGKEYLASSGQDTVAWRVPCYSVHYVSGMTIVQRNRYGDPGEFRAIRTTDEDGRQVTEFKDMNDRTVQTVQKLGNSNGGTDYLVTSYIYDGAGRLTGVLPPMLSQTLANASGAAPAWNSAQTSILFDYGYFYQYDDRGRLIAKKLPGAAWVYYIYDKGDRLVFSQDGVQRSEGKWAFALQDRLGRECVKGLCTNSLSAFAGPLDTLQVTAVRDDAYGPLYGYHVSGLTLENPEVLSVNWWDDYAFFGADGVPSVRPDSTAMAYETPETGFGARYAPSAQGLCTGTLAKVLDGVATPSYLWTVTYYDDKGQPVQKKSSTHRGGVEKESLGYSFTGEVTARKLVHVADSTGASLTERYAYTYDNWGRSLTTTYRLDNGSVTTLSDIVYDAAGRILRDYRNGTDALDTRYGYNLRGWLTDLRVGTDSATGAYGTTFLQNLYYQTPRTIGLVNVVPAQWGGNIRGTEWRACLTDDLHGYDFTYDGLSRLRTAAYNLGKTGSGTYDRTYSYDSNGNILSQNAGGTVSTGSYTGNQLTSVTEGNTSTAYTYDTDGRLSSSGGWSYSYNAIGLPYAKAGSGGVTRWTYAADGTKLSRLSPYPSSPTLDYVGNLIYEGNSLKTILVEGGYIDYTAIQNGSEASPYRFFVTDHQGNVRVVTDASGTALQVNHYDPYGTLLPITTSSPDNPTVMLNDSEESPYKYSGKEWDSRASLYDFSARMYNPSLTRFTTMDPLAEKYYSISPYAYCANNPVNFVDPEGMNWYAYQDGEGNTQYRYVEGQLSEKEINEGGYTNMGYTFSSDGVYYSLFGQKITLTQEEGRPPMGQIYKNIDDLLISYFTDQKDGDGDIKKKSMYLDNYTGKIISFSYKGTTFQSIKGIASNSKMVGDGTLYNSVGNKENSYSFVHRLPESEITIPSHQRQFRGYWLLASNGLGIYNGYSTLQIKFDRANAEQFLNAINNLFGYSFQVK